MSIHEVQIYDDEKQKQLCLIQSNTLPSEIKLNYSYSLGITD